MTLFNANTPSINLLPDGGTVLYYGKVFSFQQANHYYTTFLNNIDWKNDEAIIFGKKIITKRKVAWYGDRDFQYTYSNVTKQALRWSPELLAVKQHIEATCHEKFNSCLLNLYHTGDEGMAWHSDGEKELKKNGAIASVTFGAERKFSFKHKVTKKSISIILEHGSLLIMKDETQTNWLHRLPPTVQIQTPRINLTFRTMNIEKQIPNRY